MAWFKCVGPVEGGGTTEMDKHTFYGSSNFTGNSTFPPLLKVRVTNPEADTNNEIKYWAHKNNNGDIEYLDYDPDKPYVYLQMVSVSQSYDDDVFDYIYLRKMNKTSSPAGSWNSINTNTAAWENGFIKVKISTLTNISSVEITLS